MSTRRKPKPKPQAEAPSYKPGEMVAVRIPVDLARRIEDASPQALKGKRKAELRVAMALAAWLALQNG